MINLRRALIAPLLSLCVMAVAPNAYAGPKPKAAADNSQASVLAPLRQYSVVATAGALDANSYATVFPNAPYSFLHDYPAYYWISPTAAGKPDLAADSFHDAKVNVFVATKEVLHAPTQFEVTGDHAYAVVPAIDFGSVKGKSDPGTGTYVLGLLRIADGWRIQAFVWSDNPGTFGRNDASPAEAKPVVAAVTRYLAEDLPHGKAKLASNGTIIDEFAPYYWQGPNAMAGWSKAFQALNPKPAGLRIALDPPGRVLVKEAHAYVVVPAHLSFLINGKPDREDGAFTLALEKNGNDWSVDAWAWRKT